MKTRSLVFAASVALGAAMPAPFSWSAENPFLNTDQLKLVKASGVPHQPDHSYGFQGIVTWDYYDFGWTTAKLWAKAKGDWKGSSATESFNYQGDIVGTFVATFKCAADPWLNHGANCVVVTVVPVHKQGQEIDWTAIVKQIGRPISAGAVTLAAATELSKQSAAAVPPPPPPPPASKPASKPAISSRQQPSSATATATGQVLLTKPDLVVTGASAVAESSCNPGLPAVRVQVAVKNAGTGPFPALPGNHVIFVKTGKGLVSHGIEMPALNPGQVYPPTRGGFSQGVPIKAAVPLSQLAGTSQTLEIQLNSLKWAEESNHANNTKTVQVTFPAGYCQQKIAPGLPPASSTPAPGESRGLNPQPEPPSQPRPGLPPR